MTLMHPLAAFMGTALTAMDQELAPPLRTEETDEARADDVRHDQGIAQAIKRPAP